MMGALFFDLDETLISDRAVTAAAFKATASLAGDGTNVDVDALARAARSHADRLWQESRTKLYCQSIGISSCEALWCRFEGDGTETEFLLWLYRNRGFIARGWRRSWRSVFLLNAVPDR
jgi:hypothetical protein